MADLRDITGKNRKFTGTIGERISAGTTAQRDSDTFGAGTLRFNSTTNLMEYYTGNDWKSIDAPPVITAFTLDGGGDVTTATINSSDSGDATIEIKGSLFDTTGAVVTFVGTGETISTQTITRNSGNLLTTTVAYSDFDNTNEPYAIKVTNGSGLAAELAEAITQDQPVTFNSAADTNFNILDSQRSSVNTSTTFAATDDDGDTITYSVSAGSLPSGLTLNTSTGAITGSTDAVGSDSVSTFSITATTTDVTITRQFTITRKAPQIESITATGPGTFSVPPGVTAVDVLVVAGGGSGGQHHAGGGGAGGLIYRPALPVSPGGSVSYSVGGGGPVAPASTGNRGTDSTFGPLTAKGGGGGGLNGGPGPSTNPARGPGGSGGGRAGGNNPSPIGSGISATQPTQPGDSGTYGFGNNGGDPGQPPTGGVHGGAGGGGAGGSGSGGNYSVGGAGGVGRAYSISGSPVFYAGGGGGSVWANPSGGAGGNGGGGRGNGTNPSGSVVTPSTSGTANRGGGGGGSDRGQPGGATGGSGIIIVSY